MSLTTPVVLFTFNRPDTTRRVMDAVRQVRPTRLFVFADGPREESRTDVSNCRRARAETERIDWPCTVHRTYARSNQGIKTSIERGLAAVFDAADAAIVLEDDCLPHPSFFEFCTTLLDRFADDDRIMTIGGSKPAAVAVSGTSYAFSRYPFIWGWATWKRAWQHYDGAMSLWPDARDRGALRYLLDDSRAVQYWSYILETNIHAGRAGNWDYAWLFTSWMRHALSVVPASNLVSNIGFREDGTHCTDPRMVGANVPLSGMPFPLHHAPVERDVELDRSIERALFSGTLSRLFEEARRRIASRVPTSP